MIVQTQFPAGDWHQPSASFGTLENCVTYWPDWTRVFRPGISDNVLRLTLEGTTVEVAFSGKPSAAALEKLVSVLEALKKAL